MKLSSKQYAALSLAAEGCTVIEIAERLNISAQMASRHLSLARSKLSAKNTTNAVYKACQKGIICLLIVSMQCVESRAYWDSSIDLDFSRMTRRTRTKRDNEMTILQHIEVVGRNVVV